MKSINKCPHRLSVRLLKNKNTTTRGVSTISYNVASLCGAYYRHFKTLCNPFLQKKLNFLFCAIFLNVMLVIYKKIVFFSGFHVQIDELFKSPKMDNLLKLCFILKKLSTKNKIFLVSFRLNVYLRQ